MPSHHVRDGDIVGQVQLRSYRRQIHCAQQNAISTLIRPSRRALSFEFGETLLFFFSRPYRESTPELPELLEQATVSPFPGSSLACALPSSCRSLCCTPIPALSAHNGSPRLAPGVGTLQHTASPDQLPAVQPPWPIMAFVAVHRVPAPSSSAGRVTGQPLFPSAALHLLLLSCSSPPQRCCNTTEILSAASAASAARAASVASFAGVSSSGGCRLPKLA